MKDQMVVGKMSFSQENGLTSFTDFYIGNL